MDPEDPTVIAENELLTAASSIDAAARKLANLRPRRRSVKVMNILMIVLIYLNDKGHILCEHYLCEMSLALRYV